jgi:hypothetical protein
MGNKALLLLTCLVVSGCASTPTQRWRDSILDCTKELIEYNTEPSAAYEICSDMYRRRN